MNTDYGDRERRTARLVRACYAHYVAPGKVTAEQLYALCKLTWITKGGAKLDDGLPDNTRAVIAPALMALTGADITASAMDQLPQQLREAKASNEIIKLVAKPLGFVDFYTAFRNVARGWIGKHLRDVTRMVQLAASASSDSEVREAYERLDQLPRLPRKGGRNMPAAAPITPMLACLDPRSRSPIINRRVRERLRLLEFRHATTAEQFDDLVNFIGQAGIRDAFDLDTVDMEVLVAALKAIPRPRAKLHQAPSSGATKTLDERDDADVEFFRRSRSVTMRRLHHTMTNALRRFCKDQGLALPEEGSSPESMFDALLVHHGDRHLLVEVKTDSEQATCRLAVGQLLDYRRHLEDRARTDLAVLFPEKPSARARAFLDDVGVRVLWFNKRMTAVKGLSRL